MGSMLKWEALEEIRTEVNKGKRTAGTKQIISVATSFLCIQVPLSACFESLQFIGKIHRMLYVTAALVCRLCAGVYVFTTKVSAQ